MDTVTTSTADPAAGGGNGAPPPALKARAPGLSAEHTVAEAVAAIVSAATRQIEGNVACAADGRDPEGVHQLRVGLRRLRSGLSLFRPHLGDRAAALGDEARHALSVLGDARDLDVFLTETLPRIRKRQPADEGLARLDARARERRETAYDSVRRMLKGKRFARLLAALRRHAGGTDLVERKPGAALADEAEGLLRKRYRKLRRKGRGFARLSPEDRHKVRIALKKLRYACDYLRGLYPEKRGRAYLRMLSGLQDRFGSLNDGAVAIALARDLAGDDAVAQAGAERVAAWFAQRQAADAPKLDAAWREFRGTAPFWKG